MSDQVERSEAPEGKRVSIWLPGELLAAMEGWKGEHGPINLSAVCQPAIRAHIGAPNETEALGARVELIEAIVESVQSDIDSQSKLHRRHGQELARLKRQLDALHKLIGDRVS